MPNPIYIILTTYQREECALRTIQGVLDHARYPDGFKWILADDGSGDAYVSRLSEAIAESNVRGHEIEWAFSSPRKGVGYNMNRSLERVKEKEGQLVLMLEDDWYLEEEQDFSPFAQLLLGHEDISLIRFGYVSPGIKFHLFSRDGRLWLEALPSGYQYRYTGHPSLRHLRFHDAYGMFHEDRSPGATELGMCGKVNAVPDGPKIVLPVNAGLQWGTFHHIGAASLGGIEPGTD